MKYNHQPKQIHKTLIWGGWYGSRNIGDSAILLGIKEIYSNINFKQQYELCAISIYPTYTNSHGVKAIKALKKYDFFNFTKIINILREFLAADRVIVSGGTPIFDHGHIVRFFYLSISYIFKKEVIFLGIGVKKIKPSFLKKYLNFFLNNSRHITVRDKGSLRNINSLYQGNKIQLTADSAFLVKNYPDTETKKLFERYGIQHTSNNLVVAPRLMSELSKDLYLEEKMVKSSIGVAVQKISEVINNVSHKFDKIYIFSMHYYGIDSDRPLILEIIKNLDKNTLSKTLHIDEELTVNQALNLFSSANVTFGMRLHALLLSASMGTPIVGLAYEEKVQELFEMLKIKNSVFPLFDFDEKVVASQILYSIQENEELSKDLTIIKKELTKRILRVASEHMSIKN